jgi:hypothetical protein
MGKLCTFLAEHAEPDHSFMRLGQAGESVELDQLSSEDQPYWSQWLPQLRDSLP